MMDIKGYFKKRYEKQEPTINEGTDTDEAIKEELSKLVYGDEELLSALIEPYKALKAMEGAESLVELIHAQNASLAFLEGNQEVLTQESSPDASDKEEEESSDTETDTVLSIIEQRYGD